MSHNFPVVPQPTLTMQPQPDLHVGQQVRILSGVYRGTVGHVTDAEWDANEGRWLYTVMGEKVFFGVYSGKELW